MSLGPQAGVEEKVKLAELCGVFELSNRGFEGKLGLES